MSRSTYSRVGCCLSCGRDAHGRDLCSACRPGGGRSGMRDRHALPPVPPELEDDYGEESDANSVCDDGGNES